MIPPDYLPIAVEDRLDSATFEELADLTERSLAAAAGGMRTTLLEFVAAGAALEQMRDRMPGDYTRWLAENEIPRSTAGRMIRLHVYRDHLRDLEGFTSLNRAILSIRELPAIGTGFTTQSTPEQRAKVKKLVAAGIPKKDVAAIVGVNPSTVFDWTRPAEEQRRQRARKKEVRLRTEAAKRALAAEEERRRRDLLVRTTGGELAVAYEHVRKALAALVNAGPIDATRYLTAAENAIIRTIREERAT